MEIDVGAHIADVLFERDNVSIPGLGVLDSHYLEANADQVQGKMLPPAKELTFKRSTEPGDGSLIKYIKEKHAIAFSDAQKLVKDYISDVNQAFEDKEMIVLPGIGRLYRDFEEELQFLPDKENFNKSTFGLPPVEFLPPVRAVVPQEAPAEARPRESELPGPVSRWFARNIISIAAVTVTLLAFALYNIYFQDAWGNFRDDIRINESPSKSGGATGNVDQKTPVEAPVIGFSKAPESALPAEKPSPYDALAENIPRPKPFTAIIRVGVFSLSIHADRMAQTLKKEGFRPITDNVGKNSIVAVEIGYDDEKEIPSILENLKKKFAPDDVRLLDKKSNEL